MKSHKISPVERRYERGVGLISLEVIRVGHTIDECKDEKRGKQYLISVGWRSLWKWKTAYFMTIGYWHWSLSDRSRLVVGHFQLLLPFCLG